MSDHCDHCGEPALDTDTVCWQCGMPLPGREDLISPEEQTKKDWQQPVSQTSVAIYAGMTIIVILGAFLTMVYLGRFPLLQVRFGSRLPDDWQSIVSADKTFVLSLPDEWWWIDGESNGQKTALTDLVAEKNTYEFGTYPFGGDVADLKIQFVAESKTPSEDQLSPFLVIARSRLLNLLTYEEAVYFLLNSDYRVDQARFVEDFDKSHVSISVNTDIGEGRDLYCKQQFILGGSEAMLLSLCSSQSQFQANTNTFEDILGSFQRLDS